MKMLFLITSLCLSAFACALFAQSPSPGAQPFGLKGDVLGETLQEFRARNDHTVSTPPSAKHPGTKHMPICSDQAGTDIDGGSLLLTDQESRAGVVMCQANLTFHENMMLFGGYEALIHGELEKLSPLFDTQTIAQIKPIRTIYFFFRNRLYKIQSDVTDSDYTQLRAAFIEKYGSPVVRTARYQNAFGASLTGEKLLWENRISEIGIGQRDGVDLEFKGQHVRVTFWDKALRKEVESAGPAVKDRAKDL